MAEEQISSPRTRRDSVRIRGSDPEFDTPQSGRTDRKSLAGMSDSVKAILAPLLGGKKSHSHVEVDMGRDSGSAYETVDTGSTAMHRYSIVEASAAVETPSTSTIVTQEGTETIFTPRWSTSKPQDLFGPQKMKGKYEETVDTPARIGSPIDLAYARVDKLLPATKPKMKEYDEYITDTAPKLRARVDSILADKSHEAGFERKLPGRELELPKLEPQETPSLLDRVKDTVTGQVPSYGIYSGKATIDDPNQLGPSLQPETTVERIYRDTAREPDKGGSGRLSLNPNENMDAMRDAVATVEEKNSLERDEAPSPAIVREPEGQLPSANNSQAASVRRKSMPRKRSRASKINR